MIVKFSKYLAVNILSEWLEFNEIVTLDSSYCNKQSRGFLKSMLSSFPHAFKSSDPESYFVIKCGMLEWFRSKGMESALPKLALSEKYLLQMGKDTLPTLSEVLLHAQNIIIEYCRRYENSLIELTSCFTNVRSICLLHIGFADEILDAMARCCHSLHNISIKACAGVSINSLQLLCRANPDLLSIYCDTSFQSSPILVCLSIHCRSIRTVDCNVGRRSISGNRTNLIMMFHASPTLSQCRFANQDLALGWRGYVLSHLDLKETLCSDQNLSIMCPNLTVLAVGGFCRHLKYAWLPCTLTSLNIIYQIVRDDDLRCIGEICPKLKKLFTALDVKYANCFDHFTDLEYLYASGVNGEVLTSLAKNCKKLRSVFFSNCFYCPEAFIAMLSSCSSLTELDLNAPKSDALSAITEVAVRLRSLRLARVGSADIDAVCCLLKNCTNLTELYYTHSGVADALLPLIAAWCRKLRILNVSGCLIKLSTLHHNLPNLTGLQMLRGITDLDEVTLNELRRYVYIL